MNAQAFMERIAAAMDQAASSMPITTEPQPDIASNTPSQIEQDVSPPPGQVPALDDAPVLIRPDGLPEDVPLYPELSGDRLDVRQTLPDDFELVGLPADTNRADFIYATGHTLASATRLTGYYQRNAIEQGWKPDDAPTPKANYSTVSFRKGNRRLIIRMSPAAETSQTLVEIAVGPNAR